MKPRIFFTLALTMALTTISYAAVAQELNEAPIAQIIRAIGKVELKRENQPAYLPVTKGTYLYFGDLLRASRGASVVVRCSVDETTWSVPDDGIPWGVANTCSPSG
jgi:hypothetical protein